MPAGHHTHVSPAAPAVGQVAGALDAFCAAEGLPADIAWRLRVVLDEIVANIVAYGAPGAPPALDVWFRRDGALVEVTVADDGPAFDPLLRPDPDVTLPLEARQPGGLGITLVKSLMDDVQYERTTRNVLTIRKRIDAGLAGGGAGADEHPTNHS
jgi:serine/threonine-protein kinase RsbW